MHAVASCWMADSSFCTACGASVETPSRESRHSQTVSFFNDSLVSTPLLTSFFFGGGGIGKLLDRHRSPPTTRGSERAAHLQAAGVRGRSAVLHPQDSSTKHKERPDAPVQVPRHSVSLCVSQTHTHAHSGLVRFVEISFFFFCQKCIAAHSEE